MTPESARDFFVYLEELQKSLFLDLKEIEEAEMVAFKAANQPAKKRKDREPESFKWSAAAFDAHREKWQPIQDRFNEVRKTANEVKMDLFKWDPKPKAGPMILISSHRTGEYGSSGPQYGYAGACFERDDILRGGLQAEIRDIIGPTTVNQTRPIVIGFEVWAGAATKTDAMLARVVDPLSEEAWVERCWNAGCNPRVFKPFLPHESRFDPPAVRRNRLQESTSRGST